MSKKQRKYDVEYKIQTVKLAKEIGGAKAAAPFRDCTVSSANRE